MNDECGNLNYLCKLGITLQKLTKLAKSKATRTCYVLSQSLSQNHVKKSSVFTS